MNPETIHNYAIWAALAAAVLAAAGEGLHARRVARLGALAFGPTGRPRRWTKIVAPLRVISFAGIAWALVTLISFNNCGDERNAGTKVNRHLFVLLDVSPSMLLADAGEGGGLTRKARAGQVIKSVLERVQGDDVRFTIAGFYTEMRVLIGNGQDREMILHFSSDIPLHIMFPEGKTDILSSINQAGKIMQDWPPKSTTLLVISDGDSVPPSGLKLMPPAVTEVLFAGVGDDRGGTFIDGHLSRQDKGSLTQLASRLNGKYFDCNTHHLPSDVLENLNCEVAETAVLWSDRRLIAAVVLVVSVAWLCLAPLLLEYLGSGWRPGRQVIQPQPKTAV